MIADPYKGSENKHKITLWISEEDHRLLFERIAPRHGMQQRIGSTLFFGLLQKIKEEIDNGRLDPTIPLQENLSKLESILRGYALGGSD